MEVVRNQRHSAEVHGGDLSAFSRLIPRHSPLLKAFDRIKMALWRVLLRLSSQLHDPDGHAAMDATVFD